MTYSELYERAIKKLNLKQEDIEDYRPAAELYIEQVTGTIPDAIITATAPANDSKPALTKLTTITIVALDD